MTNDNKKENYEIKRFSTGSKNLDSLLEGGIEAGIITQFYGEAGSGKTNICLQLCKVTVLEHGKKVILIDTEAISTERLKQICGADADFQQVLRSILVYKPYSMAEQSQAVESAVELAMYAEANIGLIIIDCMTIFYRMELDDDETGRKAREELGSQIIKLMTTARKCNIPVVITNQVYTDIKTDTLQPLARNVIGLGTNTIIMLERLDDSKRRATLIKHRSLPAGRTVEFELTYEGVV